MLDVVIMALVVENMIGLIRVLKGGYASSVDFLLRIELQKMKLNYKYFLWLYGKNTKSEISEQGCSSRRKSIRFWE